MIEQNASSTGYSRVNYTNPDVGAETRPRNIALLAHIKF
jgi:hypothetical protein